MFARRGWSEESKNCWIFRLKDGTSVMRIRKHKGESGSAIVIVEAAGGERHVERFRTQEQADAWISQFKRNVKDKI